MLNLPPPARIALGTVNISGKEYEIFASVEWARYFQSLNIEVQTTSLSMSSLERIALLGDNASDTPDLLPGPPGQAGQQGNPGLALFMLQDTGGDEQMLVPPSAGASSVPIAGTFTTVTASAGFGCNGKTAQAAAASGGTLAGVIAALVANGILSS